MPKCSSVVPDLTGRVVNDGRYKLVQMLGSGTFGVVYRSVNLRKTEPSASEIEAVMPHTVAIKTLHIRDKSDREVQRIRREVALHHIASEHKGVVLLYDVFEDDDFIYMVMDFCESGDLYSKIIERDEEGKLLFWRNDQLVKKVFLQILDALESCHQKGVYHRDLKPENILCDKSGEKVFLADFGLATNSSVGNCFGCGTSAYMSPECVDEFNRKLSYTNEGNDVWALGPILLSMLTARSPWRRAVTSEAVFRRFLRNPWYLQEVVPISNGMVEIMSRICAWDPRVRPTLAQLRRGIQRIDTFWMTEEEVANAPSAAKFAAEFCAAKANLDDDKDTFFSAQEEVAKGTKEQRIQGWVRENQSGVVYDHHEPAAAHPYPIPTSASDQRPSSRATPSLSSPSSSPSSPSPETPELVDGRVAMDVEPSVFKLDAGHQHGRLAHSRDAVCVADVIVV